MSELSEHPVILASSTVLSSTERTETSTGDPNFMTSLARGLAATHAFQECKRYLTTARTSHRTEVLRAAVCRCLYTLMQLGYTTTDGRTCLLLLKVLTLGHAYLSSTSLVITAQSTLDRLSEQLHEACSTATLEGDNALYIARSATPQRLVPMDLNVGSRLPAYCTLMGRILLTMLNDDMLHAYFGGVEIQAKISRTLHTPEALLPCLVEICRQGWCTVDQELEVGLRPLVVPVRDSAGHVLAAPNVSTHAGQVPRTELGSRFLLPLLKINRKLSARPFA